MPVAKVVMKYVDGKRNDKVNAPSHEISVETNVTIQKIVRLEADKGEAALVDLELGTGYEPDLGYLKIGVQVLYHGEKGKILTKDDKLVPETAAEIHSLVLRGAPILAAISMARELNLPMPINFPRVEIKKDGKKK